MNTSNPLIEKSFDFAYLVSKACLEIRLEHREFDLSRQLIRSATSIGANIEEAAGGNSKKDFYYKLTIAYKEARESKYWLRLLIRLDLIDQSLGEDLLLKSEELLKLIGSIQKTMRNRYNFNYK